MRLTKHFPRLNAKMANRKLSLNCCRLSDNRLSDVQLQKPI